MKKLNKLGYTKVEVLVITVLLGIVAFITINKASYAFANDDAKAVNDIISLIEKQAQEYGIDHLDIFGELDVAYINVDDLIENDYLIPNSEGKITNPSDSSKSFNSNKIKLELDTESQNVVATFVN